MIALAGCGAPTTRAVGTPPAERSEPAAVADEVAAPRQRLVAIDWVLRPADRQSQVLLTLTDETGAASNLEVGSFEGECESDDLGGADDPQGTVLGLICRGDGDVTLLRVVRRDDRLVVLRAVVDATLAEPSYEEHTSADIPSSATVRPARQR